MSAQRVVIENLLLEHRISGKGGMPTFDELDLAEATLAYTSEFFIEPALRRVFRLLNDDYESFEIDRRTHPVSWEDIGTLLAAVTNIQDDIDYITSLLKAVELSRRDLSIVAETGRVESEPLIDSYGRARAEMLETVDAR